MKLARQKRQELVSAAIVHSLVLIVACFGLFVLTAYATDPAWWSSVGIGAQPAVMAEQVVTNDDVVTTNYIPNDYAAVTQGQLKQFTARAVDYLNANLPGGAGTNLNSMVSNWIADYTTNGYSATNLEPSDYTAMTAGQLKYIGNKVWNQLVTAGYTSSVPSWLALNTNSDSQVANLGQLKQVFNFDLLPLAVTGLTAMPADPYEIDLSWTLPAVNTASYLSVLESTDGGTTWTTIATIDPTLTFFAATGLDPTLNYIYQIGSTNGFGTSDSSPTDPDPPPVDTRYIVIDFGTDFSPAGINDSFVVAGNAGSGTSTVPQFWSPQLGTSVPTGLATNSAYSTNWVYAVGIDNSNHIVGNIAFATTNQVGTFNSGVPPTFTPDAGGGSLAYYWSTTNTATAPTLMGQVAFNSVPAPWYGSTATHISNGGFIVGIDGTYNNYSGSDLYGLEFNPSWNLTYMTTPTTNVFGAGPYGAPPYLGTFNAATNLPSGLWTTPTGAGGTTNWCGYFNYSDLGFYEGPVVDGTYYSGYSAYHPSSLNSSNIVVGSMGGNPVMAIPSGGSTLTLSTNGLGAARLINDATTVTGGTNTYTPQVTGVDNLGNATLWDQTTLWGTNAVGYSATNFASYVGKNINQLIPPNTWQVFDVSEGLNNYGAMVGFATKLSDHTTHGILLLPATITRDNLPINSTNSTVWVGQQINLTNMISGIPTNAFTYQWTIPGANNTTNDTAFYDYEPDTSAPYNHSNYTNLFSPTNYTTNSFVQYYWSADGSNQVVNSTEVIYGQTNIVSATFNVNKPQFSVSATNGMIGAGTNYFLSSDTGEPYLYCGASTNYSSVGISFYTNAISSGIPGSFEWVQLINNAVVTQGGTNIQTVVPGLDTTYPYQTLHNNLPIDSPASSIDLPYTSISEVFDATMYLMWKASTNSVGGDQTIWVPLRAYNWKYNATATNNTPTNIGNWGIQTNYFPTTNDFEATNEPTWSTNSENSWH